MLRWSLTTRFLVPVGLVLAVALAPLVWVAGPAQARRTERVLRDRLAALGVPGAPAGAAALERDVARTRWLAALVGLGALATTGLVAAYFVRRSILRPLGDLAAAIGRMGPWDLDVQAHVERPDEIGRLAEAFNAMVVRLRRSNQDYMEVLAFVSHELKHPIASMVTDARVLADGYLGPVTADQARKLERLAAAGNQLLELVGEYLDLARIEAGNLELQARPVPFREQVVEPAAALVQAQAQARRMVLELCVPGDLEPVECDPHLLKVVLVNLLGNGVKYGREGGSVRLTVEVVPGRLKVAVRNQGPGFPSWERNRLFHKFSRLQDPVLRARKGTGLGLYTSWHIVQLHGGTMDAYSEPGQWAEFSFQLHQPLRWDGILGNAAADAGLLEDLPAVDG